MININAPDIIIQVHPFLGAAGQKDGTRSLVLVVDGKTHSTYNFDNEGRGQLLETFAVQFSLFDALHAQWIELP